MNPIELMAAFLAVVTLVKIAMYMYDRDAMLKRGAKAVKNAESMQLVMVLLTAVVAYFIFSVYSVVEVAAMMLLTILVIDVHLLCYPRALPKLMKEMSGEKLAWTAWLWVAFALWVLYTLFA